MPYGETSNGSNQAVSNRRRRPRHHRVCADSRLGRPRTLGGGQRQWLGRLNHRLIYSSQDHGRTLYKRQLRRLICHERSCSLSTCLLAGQVDEDAASLVSFRLVYSRKEALIYSASFFVFLDTRIAA